MPSPRDAKLITTTLTKETPMPVRVELHRSALANQSNLTPVSKTRSHQERSSRSISIGLINNMPHAAFTATERQFISVLNAASEGFNVRMHFYSLVDLPKSSVGDVSPGTSYSSIDTLWETKLDGLIVTGKEPITTNLKDEPCWNRLTQVLEWARENTCSTVWSCLAAHAAVLYMDGISRHKNHEKHCGIFECARVSSHPLMEGAPSKFCVPHSRWNSLFEEELVLHEYSVLSRIAGLEVDAFMKDENSLFVFFQGHLEYDSDTLLREYRRDVCRYLNHEALAYPSIPAGYFDWNTEDTLMVLQDKIMFSQNKELFASLSTVLEAAKVKDTWHSTTALIYGNWLRYIHARKSESQLDDACVA
jgi:homoserine O-succinyltransferase